MRTPLLAALLLVSTNAALNCYVTVLNSDTNTTETVPALQANGTSVFDVTGKDTCMHYCYQCGSMAPQDDPHLCNSTQVADQTIVSFFGMDTAAMAGGAVCVLSADSRSCGQTCDGDLCNSPAYYTCNSAGKSIENTPVPPTPELPPIKSCFVGGNVPRKASDQSVQKAVEVLGPTADSCSQICMKCPAPAQGQEMLLAMATGCQTAGDWVSIYTAFDSTKNASSSGDPFADPESGVGSFVGALFGLGPDTVRKTPTICKTANCNDPVKYSCDPKTGATVAAPPKSNAASSSFTLGSLTVAATFCGILLAIAI